MFRSDSSVIPSSHPSIKMYRVTLTATAITVITVFTR